MNLEPESAGSTEAGDLAGAKKEKPAMYTVTYVMLHNSRLELTTVL